MPAIDLMVQVYYEMISSKSVKDLEMLVDWFQSPNNPYRQLNKRLKEYLENHPVDFSQTQVKEKEIYQKLLSSLG